MHNLSNNKIKVKSEPTCDLVATQLNWLWFENAETVNALHYELIHALLGVGLNGEADGGPVVGDDALECRARLFLLRLEWHIDLRQLTELWQINTEHRT